MISLTRWHTIMKWQSYGIPYLGGTTFTELLYSSITIPTTQKFKRLPCEYIMVIPVTTERDYLHMPAFYIIMLEDFTICQDIVENGINVAILNVMFQPTHHFIIVPGNLGPVVLCPQLMRVKLYPIHAQLHMPYITGDIFCCWNFRVRQKTYCTFFCQRTRGQICVWVHVHNCFYPEELGLE